MALDPRAAPARADIRSPLLGEAERSLTPQRAFGMTVGERMGRREAIADLRFDMGEDPHVRATCGAPQISEREKTGRGPACAQAQGYGAACEEAERSLTPQRAFGMTVGERMGRREAIADLKFEI